MLLVMTVVIDYLNYNIPLLWSKHTSQRDSQYSAEKMAFDLNTNTSYISKDESIANTD